MRFRTTIKQSGKTATGIEIPEAVMNSLASGRRPPVRVTIGGYTYRSTVATVDGKPMVGLSAEHRAGAGVEGGQEVEVDIALDTEKREVILPPELAAALDAEPRARATFEALSPSNKSWHVIQVTGAKTDETRERRIARSIEALREGRPH
jgi:Bacteriocin-protection, YdeI or OmpD-Associated/Domain of unknown function (DUF1905)